MTNEEKAQQDFDMLKLEFKKLKGNDNSLETYHILLDYFAGYNDTDNELFDFNYKHLTATIVRNKGIIELIDDIDFYESDDYSPDKFFLQRVS